LRNGRAALWPRARAERQDVGAMDVQHLVDNFAHASLPGFGALIAAWLAWRLWRRIIRAAVACVVVGVVLYVAFPGLAHQLIPNVLGGTGLTH
jgi:hypothetical protein